MRNLLSLHGQNVDVYRPTLAKASGTDEQVETRPSTPALTGVRVLIAPMPTELQALVVGNVDSKAYTMQWLTDDIRMGDVVLWNGSYYDVEGLKDDTLRRTLKSKSARLIERLRYP